MGREHPAGKGDTPRDVDRVKFGENMDRIFGVKPIIKTWNPDEEEKETEEDSSSSE